MFSTNHMLMLVMGIFLSVLLLLTSLLYTHSGLNFTDSKPKISLWCSNLHCLFTSFALVNGTRKHPTLCQRTSDFSLWNSDIEYL